MKELVFFLLKLIQTILVQILKSFILIPYISYSCKFRAKNIFILNEGAISCKTGFVFVQK